MAISVNYPYHSHSFTSSQSNDPVNLFANKYQIKEINVAQDYNQYQYAGGSGYSNFNSPYDRTVNITMNMNAFQHLVKNESRGDVVIETLRKEEWLRNKHPALQDAWEKYQMLLTLMDR